MSLRKSQSEIVVKRYTLSLTPSPIIFACGDYLLRHSIELCFSCIPCIHYSTRRLRNIGRHQTAYMKCDYNKCH